MKEIVILGSTGSIGKQTLDVVRSHPDKFSVSTIEEFKEAYALAHAGEEAAMIHIETDLYGS